MNTKLTLSINEHAIADAKYYARAHNTSVSKIVEQFFNTIASKTAVDLTGVVAELAGVIADIENDYSDFLETKYK